MDETICRDVTAQRIRKAIEGYGDTSGLGGGFRFCNLAQLFDEAGNIAGEVKFTDLAAHVFFTETGVPIPKRAKSDCPFLAFMTARRFTCCLMACWGISGRRRKCSDAFRRPPYFAHASGWPGPRVVYGEACRLGPKSLEQYGITFRQIPFELKVD